MRVEVGGFRELLRLGKVHHHDLAREVKRIHDLKYRGRE